MDAGTIAGLTIVFGIIAVIIALTVAVTVLAIKFHNSSMENAKLRLDIERMKNSPKDRSIGDFSWQGQMASSQYYYPPNNNPHSERRFFNEGQRGENTHLEFGQQNASWYERGQRDQYFGRQ